MKCHQICAKMAYCGKLLEFFAIFFLLLLHFNFKKILLKVVEHIFVLLG